MLRQNQSPSWLSTSKHISVRSGMINEIINLSMQEYPTTERGVKKKTEGVQSCTEGKVMSWQFLVDPNRTCQLKHLWGKHCGGQLRSFCLVCNLDQKPQKRPVMGSWLPALLKQGTMYLIYPDRAQNDLREERWLLDFRTMIKQGMESGRLQVCWHRKHHCRYWNRSDRSDRIWNQLQVDDRCRRRWRLCEEESVPTT